jgi:hypothetical protein
MKYYEEVWSFKYQCVRPSRQGQYNNISGVSRSRFRGTEGDSTYALEEKPMSLIAKEDSAVTFPKVDTSEMEEYGVETYGSIEGRKAMNKTLASKAILPLTEVPESSSYNTNVH